MAHFIRIYVLKVYLCRMKNIYFLLLVSLLGLGFQADKPAYRIYQINGKKTSYGKMLTTLKDADVVFFGELHDNPIAHWLQFELTADLYKERGEEILLGSEMSRLPRPATCPAMLS